ncbi:MAG: DUF1343 domain-containing protein [Bacteroidota bacterium]|nr:DUF1343 domain-containing protein [Bacteroidota bacterium]
MKKLTFILLVKYTNWTFLLFFLLIQNNVSAQILGAEQTEAYLPLLQNKRVGLVVNQTSVVNKMHLVDFLRSKQINITSIFAPEHGFRGDHSAGEKVKSSIDAKTKLPVYSLYGVYKKPNEQQLKELDIIVFDIQDVGARFYTYLSTLHYVMEACAEQKKKLIVLDRPNPNGYYIDGPVLDTAFRSFVGMHPVPVVHGLTVGEYARMINGEGWLKNQASCDLQVIKMKQYTHQTPYVLPIKPSPNLPNMSSVLLYPSLCFFEGTNYSVGRGTPYPFEFVGKPNCSIGNDTITPRHLPGIADHPPHENKQIRGFNLTDYGWNIAPGQKKINLYWLIELYNNDSNKDKFFTNFFDKLAGTDELRKQIMAGKNEAEIRASWKDKIEAYKLMRRRYLLYADAQ